MSVPCSDTAAAEGFCYGCTSEQWTGLTASLDDAAATIVCSAFQTITTSESDLAGSVQGLAAGLNCLYLVLCAALVFIMHGGFAMVSQRPQDAAPDCSTSQSCALISQPCRFTRKWRTGGRISPSHRIASVHLSQLCAGAIRSKNTMNILLQTILDAAVSAIAFYLVG